MIVRYDDSMDDCPFCLKDGAIVKLVKGTDRNKYCPFHGQITGRDFWEDPKTGKPIAADVGEMIETLEDEPNPQDY